MRKAKPANNCSIYQAKILTSFAVLGIRTDAEWLTDIDYLPLDTPLLPPINVVAAEACSQLQAYLQNPRVIFDLPLHISGTQHQQRVWQQIQAIPPGTTRSYAEFANLLHSSPRAVGQACGANRLPIVIPCHRVIAKNGSLGGFMHASDGMPLMIKQWLLSHERNRPTLPSTQS
ncbi:MAG: methylated-DNA--[protein]-cysteine S-methyltransferase [Nitrosomonas sp.]|nr:methylated-DNA--[protein]-cysteine S-methyltransferase [Nitrosomonas sp.]